jgi:single-strand DNA-binding protein
MSSLNKACILGNVGKAPEVRTTPGGSKVATLSVATSRKWVDGKGEKQEKTEWHRLVVWNRGKSGLADVVERYVGKGAKIYIEGAIEYRQYEKDGQTRYITEINVSELVLLGGGDKAERVETGEVFDDDLPF